MRKTTVVISAAAFMVASLAPLSLLAQAPMEFYKGKAVTLQIGSGPGGGYDILGRLFARYMGKYIPGNPSIMPQNVPGGGSLYMANQFASITSRDGTVFGIFNTGMALTPLLTPGVVRYDPRRFRFIGSPNREAHVLIASSVSPIKTIDDVFSKEMIVAATAPGGAPFDFPLLTNEILGTKFRIVAGYKSSNDAKLATERGEVHGQAGHGWTAVKSEYADDLAKKRIIVVAAFGMQKHADLKDVPLMPTGKTEEERQLFNLMYSRQVIGRPLMTPPDVAPDRLKLLREAYAATVKDEGFLAEAERFKVDIDPVYHEELERLLTELYATPPSIVKRMQEILETSANK